MWRGNEDGYILECTPYRCTQSFGSLISCEGHAFYWSPEAVAVGPTAEELAQRAVAEMHLTMGGIGSTPPIVPENPVALGSIGLPIWLWIADRSENAIGPITKTVTDGGLTVRATGVLDHVEWRLTNARGNTVATVTCVGPNAAGTPYDGRDTAEPSPTCGFGAGLNQTPGRLTLTGTAYWTVEWQADNQAGTIDIPPQSESAQLRMGETQILVQD